jgi:hypothetical protein
VFTIEHQELVGGPFGASCSRTAHPHGFISKNKHMHIRVNHKNSDAGTFTHLEARVGALLLVTGLLLSWIALHFACMRQYFSKRNVSRKVDGMGAAPTCDKKSRSNA